MMDIAVSDGVVCKDQSLSEGFFPNQMHVYIVQQTIPGPSGRSCSFNCLQLS